MNAVRTLIRKAHLYLVPPKFDLRQVLGSLANFVILTALTLAFVVCWSIGCWRKATAALRSYRLG